MRQKVIAKSQNCVLSTLYRVKKPMYSDILIRRRDDREYNGKGID